jgi:hypothetical protein
VVDWVMRAEGVSFRHAVELLRDGMPAISPAGRAPGRSTVRKLASPLERDAADDELLGQVTDYHQALRESPDALAYLARRKIGHPEAPMSLPGARLRGSTGTWCGSPAASSARPCRSGTPS